MSKQTVNHQQQEQLIANSKDTESLYSTDWKHTTGFILALLGEVR